MKNFSIDDIPAEFHKAWHYANNFMITAIKSEAHCEIFLEISPEWNEEEKQFLLWAWILITTGVDTQLFYVSYGELDEEEPVVDIEEMTKKELDAYAEEEYGIELDSRQSHKNMIKELKERQIGRAHV